MKRRAIAAIWIAGATVPLLAATVFLFGCCVLPFHRVVHKLMPVCELAAAMMRGDRGHQHDATPAPEKQEPVKRIATVVPQVFRLAAATTDRSFITLGAVRCDRDVGLHVLVETFRI